MKRKTLSFALKTLFTYFLVIITLLAVSSIVTAQESAAFKLTSPSFEHMGDIPVKYSCDGDSISPPLEWEGVPEGCVSMVIIMEDADAPEKNVVHWLVWNLDPKLGGLEEGVFLGLVQAFTGKNDFDKHGYMGPCLESGSHVYQIKLYALREKIELTTDSTKTELLKAMSGKIVKTSTLMGVYGK
jgi:Raf kinase inhibitor-like YbhB/YbcL family protein